MNVIYQNHGWNVQSVFALLKPKPKALITDNSVLIKHGMLGFFSPSSMKKKMRYFFLFDRAFIVTAPMKKKFRLKIYIHLRPGVELVDDPDDTQFRLNVVYKGKGVPMIMYADSIKEKNAWIRDIDTALWKIRDGDCSLEAGNGVLNSRTGAPTPFSPLSLSETDISKASDPRVNRKSAYVNTKEDEQIRQRRSRSNTTNTLAYRKSVSGPLSMDEKKAKGDKSSRPRPSLNTSNDSAMRFPSDEEDSSDDEEDRQRRQRKAEKRRAQQQQQLKRDPSSGAISPRGSRAPENPISPRGARNPSPPGSLDARRAESQQIPTRPPGSTGYGASPSSSVSGLAHGLEFMNLNTPPALPQRTPSQTQGLNYQQQLQQPLGQFQQFGSNSQLLSTQQTSPLSPRSQPLSPPTSYGQQQQYAAPTSLGTQPLQPQSQPLSPPTSASAQQSAQPMLYAVPAQQGQTQGTYYLDPTAYAHYVQQLQMQQLQLMQQQQLLQQQQLAQGTSPGAPAVPAQYQYPTAERTV